MNNPDSAVQREEESKKRLFDFWFRSA